MAVFDTTTALFPSPEVFPHELLKEIFSHCDPPTLARVSGVSFACLELSAPFFYTDIVLRTTTSVIKLFRMEKHRSPSSPAPAVPRSTRVSPHTSLSLIHTFTFEPDIDFSPAIFETFARPTPVPVQVLNLSVLAPTAVWNRFPHNFGPVLHLVNPKIAIFQGPELPEIADRLPGLIGTRTLRGRPTPVFFWDRLTTVIIRDARVDLVNLAEIRAGLPVDPAAIAREKWAVRVVYDFGNCSGVDAGRTSGDLIHWLLGAELDKGAFGLAEMRLHAWIESQDLKAAVEQRLTAAPRRPTDHTTVVVVPSGRLCRLRDEMALGVRKKMDWAALDDA